MAQAGRKVAVIERRWIGGSCPNINCLPSKNEIWSAGVAHAVAHAGAYGVATGPVSVDMKTVVARKRAMVESLVAFHLERYEATGAELIMGNARVIGPETIEVALNDGGTRLLVAEKLFLNLGTHATIPPVPGLAEAKPLTHIEALELDRLPAHLIVLGGGHVGLELAQAYRRFGSRVTIVDRGPRLLKREDEDVSDEIRRILEAEGIEVLLSAEIEKVEGRSAGSVRATIRTSDGSKVIEGTDMLVAAGRTPNTRGIGLEEAGVALTDRGYIQVNERLETTARDVWAIGECAGATRTFWDKIVIAYGLRRWYERRGVLRQEGQRVSRHYYELHCLLQSEVGQIAIADLDLGTDCVRHARMFFDRPDYDLASALPGSFAIEPITGMVRGTRGGLCQHDSDDLRCCASVRRCARLSSTHRETIEGSRGRRWWSPQRR
nr:FAD-dependent oxidoreductase [Aminobacter aganoensis]